MYNLKEQLQKQTCFQFLGIPPKGELLETGWNRVGKRSGFQFLGIPPKGELYLPLLGIKNTQEFPISRDPPEGGTTDLKPVTSNWLRCFQFLGIPPKGEHCITTSPFFRDKEVSNF